MEEELNLDLIQILRLVNQMPHEQLKKVKAVIDKKLEVKKPKSKELTDFQKFLLEGPIMSNKQYKEYLEDKKYMNQWSEK